MIRNNNFIFPLLIVGAFLVLASSCEKEDDNINGNNANVGLPVLSTTAVTDISWTTAKSGGYITSDCGATVTERGVCWSTNLSPTISDNKTTNGAGAGKFSSKLIDLSHGTTYYVRAYATNSNGTGYGSTMVFTTRHRFTDSRDGNVYLCVTIGEQIWMAENLRYLPSVVGPGIYSDTKPYYYVYGYEGTDVAEAKVTANYNIYGVLYNWIAAMNGADGSDANPSGVQGICPEGWHLPSDAEWTQLINYLGGESVAGDYLKEIGTKHWNAPNERATNETGFTALPGGRLGISGSFNNIGSNGFWWSAAEYDEFDAWYRYMTNKYSEVGRYSFFKDAGLSVRCVKD